MDLSIIIVNYNMTAHLKRCVESIYKFTKGVRFEVIVVDNNSTDKGFLNLADVFSNLKIFFRDENSGFGSGCNYGARFSNGKYILIMNPDIVLIDNSIKKMLDFIETHPDVGIIGSLLLNENTEYQISYSRFPTILSIVCDLTGMWRLKTKKISTNLSNMASDFIESDWITGACMLVRKDLYEETGGFDERFFMYEEDVDLCYRIKKAGWKVGCFTGTSIIHNEGSSSQCDYYRYILMRNKSRITYMEKHFSVIKLFLSRLISIMILIPKSISCLILPNIDNRKLRFRGYLKSISYYVNPGKFLPDIGN